MRLTCSPPNEAAQVNVKRARNAYRAEHDRPSVPYGHPTVEGRALKGDAAPPFVATPRPTAIAAPPVPYPHAADAPAAAPAPDRRCRPSRRGGAPGRA